MRRPNSENDTAVKIAKSCGFKTSQYLCLISKLKQPQVPVTILPGRIVCSAIYHHGSPVLTLYSKHDNLLQCRIMSAVASQITGVSIVCSTVGSSADQIKPQSSASLFFCAGNSPVTVEFPAQRPVKRKCLHLMTSSCRPVCWRRMCLGLQEVPRACFYQF